MTENNLRTLKDFDRIFDKIEIKYKYLEKGIWIGWVIGVIFSILVGGFIWLIV